MVVFDDLPTEAMRFAIELAESPRTAPVARTGSDPSVPAALLPEGEERVVSGRVEFYRGTPQIVHPDPAAKAAIVRDRATARHGRDWLSSISTSFLHVLS